MADIFHNFQIKANLEKAFEAVSSPNGLDAWWTKHSTGKAAEGNEYELGFGPEYNWHAIVSQCVNESNEAAFELKLTNAHEDWRGTRVGFVLHENNGVTDVQFHHTGWPKDNAHYRISCYCWAMYLRLLKRYLEQGETVRYEERLNV